METKISCGSRGPWGLVPAEVEVKAEGHLTGHHGTTRGSYESLGQEAGALGSSPVSATKGTVTLGKSGPLVVSDFLASKMALIIFALLLSCGHHSDQSIS